MTKPRFTELLSIKLTNEISTDENEEFLRMINENEDYKREYEMMSEYFNQKEEPDKNSSALFQKIKNRINHEK